MEKKRPPITIRIFTILIGIIGLLLSLWALFIEFIIGASSIPLDERLAVIFGIIISILYLISNIGIMMLKKKAVKLNLITAFPFIILMLYVQLSPRMVIREYLALSIFGRIVLRNPDLIVGLVMFSIYYIPSIIFLTRPKVKEQFKKEKIPNA